jgi:acyl-CoA reductase-like NAD-dependent aldehyde dehydrogenase
MKGVTRKGTITTLTTHYIERSFVESNGREVMDIVRPTDGQIIGRVTLADQEDTRRAIAAARRAFASYGRSTKEERSHILRRLHKAASARVDDLTAAMVEEYGGVVQFAGLIVQSGVGAFLAAEQALQEMEWSRSWDNTTVTLEPVGVAGLITAWNANTLFICLKLASAVAAGCTVVVKPSEMSALQTQALIEALHEAKLPQACAAGTRLLVPSNRLDAVKQAIREAMRAFPVGDPADPKIAVGPMASQKQYERVQSYIRKGMEEGAQLGHPFRGVHERQRPEALARTALARGARSGLRRPESIRRHNAFHWTEHHLHVER